MFLANVPALGVEAGERAYIEHPQLQDVPPEIEGGGWAARLLVNGNASGITEALLARDGSFRIAAGNSFVGGSDAECDVELLHATAADYLGQILDGHRP